MKTNFYILTFLQQGNRGLGVEARISIRKDMIDPNWCTYFRFSRGKIPGMSSGIEECKIPAGARDFHDQ
jgi:hypothetical protein